MKILTAKQIKEADLHTIRVQGITSADLMERAASAFSERFIHYYNSKQPVTVICGNGNNGGDGLAIARLLAAKNYNVQVFIIHLHSKETPDFSINLKRLSEKKVRITPVRNVKDVELIKASREDTIAIDALLGTGLNKPLYGLPELVIHRVNTNFKEIVSVDIPSGMYSDMIYHDSLTVIKASRTFTFETPKLAFMFPSNYKNTGDWEVLPIGLDQEFILQQESPFFLDRKMIKGLLKKRHKFAHKGTFGHALLIAGSYGKMGAAVLAARACMKSGAGLLTTLIPECGYTIMQTAVPEAMVLTGGNDYLYAYPFAEKKYEAIGIGPGIGTQSETAQLLTESAFKLQQPVVLDADALNILAGHSAGINKIPRKSILTPHVKEFDRLFEPSAHEAERFEKQCFFSAENQLIIILKGAYSCITFPDGQIFFNPTGNPGMATAGSGDVLTGILTGLLAQGYSPEETALLGTYLHGLAGDIAAEDTTQEALIATDLINCISHAFKTILRF